VGNQEAPAKARLWYFGVAVAVGVTTFLKLAQGKRTASRAQAADDGRARQGPNAAVVHPPDGIIQVRHRSGIPRLARWAAGRTFWALVVAGIGYWSLTTGISSSNWVNPRTAITVPATATVIKSYSTGDYEDYDFQIFAYVQFRTKSDHIVRTTIEPDIDNKPARGRKILIRYNPRAPSQAIYADPGGDAQYPPPIPATAAYVGCCLVQPGWRPAAYFYVTPHRNHARR
jgi:hypothetical protein